MSSSGRPFPPPTPTQLMRGQSEVDDANSPKRRFSPGDHLAGRFQIVRWIANGGMGEVYEAYDTELEEPVALKVIRADILSSDKTMRRFRREISLARQVTHPNVCRIFGFFYHQEGTSDLVAPPHLVATPYLVATPHLVATPKPTEDGTAAETVGFLTMELLVGETLSDYLPPGKRLSAGQALPIARQMAEALGAAHAAGIVHRDFKCSNVMIVEGAEGKRAVVTDFGLAHGKIDDGRESKLTVQGEIIGSPAYMAPEQALGQKPTPAVDIYAFGVVLYRLVTGRLPFAGTSPIAQLAKRLKEDPTPPGEIVDDLDPIWDAAICRCLEREPEDRFASMDDLLVALDPASLGNRSSESQPATEIATSVPSPARWRPWMTVAGVTVAVTLAWLGFLATAFDSQLPDGVPSAPLPHTETRTSLAVLGFNNLSGSADAAWLAIALAELLTTELAAGDRLRVIPRERVERLAKDLHLQSFTGMAPDTLERVGQRLANDYVLLGSYLATGDTERHLRLDLRLQSTASGQTIATLSDTASEFELLTLAERLGSALRSQLTSETGIDLQTHFRPPMPSNPRAARLYAEGLAKLRAFDTTGARDLILEAIDADPDFPLARAALAEAYATLGFEKDAAEQIRLAFEQPPTRPAPGALLPDRSPISSLQPAAHGSAAGQEGPPAELDEQERND